jgi:hypothetical protein
LSLEIHSCHIPLHGRYFSGCHDCSTFFRTSVTKIVNIKFPFESYEKTKLTQEHKLKIVLDVEKRAKK